MVRMYVYSDRRGFTLIEAVVVVALVGAILLFALPSYSNYTSNQRTLAAARTLRADLGVARQEAVARRAQVTVTFATDDARCRPRGGAAYTLSHPGGIIKWTCLHEVIQWTPTAGAPLIFESTGAPRTGRILTLRSARTGASHWVAVTADTGAITSDVP